jgi:hypothetical protein
MIRQLSLWLLASASFFIEPTHAFHVHQSMNAMGSKTRLNMLDPVTAGMNHFSEWMQHSSSLVLSSDAVTNDLLSPPEAGGISYSKASYYTVLGLYLISFPGLWSTVKRSTKAKVKRKTFVTPGEASSDPKAMSLRQQAGEIMACTYCLGV